MVSPDMSGAHQRPELIDFLLVSEHDRLSATLELRLGAIEVGLVEVSGGHVTHAELPGVTGDAALTLLARMTNLHVNPEPGQPRLATITRPWRVFFGEQALASSPARTEGRHAARALLAEVGSSPGPLPEPSDIVPSGAGPTPLARVAATIFDQAAIQAYLDGELAHARALLVQRERLAAGDLLANANLERLRLRLLEDELVSSVSEVAE